MSLLMSVLSILHSDGERLKRLPLTQVPRGPLVPLVDHLPAERRSRRGPQGRCRRSDPPGRHLLPPQAHESRPASSVR